VIEGWEWMLIRVFKREDRRIQRNSQQVALYNGTQKTKKTPFF
jgi:hypothetical protein